MMFCHVRLDEVELATWQEYQTRTAEFFQGIGLEATVNERLVGVRTTHDIDVVVRSRHAGFAVLWLVECKHWQTAVSKLHVLALREIVADLGADRGLLMAEHGFQSGALEAAQLTNVRLTSLRELVAQATSDISMMRLRDFQDRLDDLHDRYWRMNKSHRIAHGLRPEAPEVGYQATLVIDTLREALSAGARGRLPFEPGLGAMVDPTLHFEATNAVDLLKQVEPHLEDVERRIRDAEQSLPEGAT